MPWPFDNQGGDPIVEGLLASQKFQLLQEELQQSRLQRAEYEAGAQSRALMRDLALQREQSALRTDKTREGLTFLQQQLAELELATSQATQDATISTAKSNAERAGTEAKQAKFNLERSEKTAPLVEAGLKADLVGKNLQNAGQGIQNLMGVAGLSRSVASPNLDAKDVTVLASQLAALTGSKDETGVLPSIIGAQINAQIQAGQQEIASNQAAIKTDKAQQLATIIAQGPAAVKAALATGEFPEFQAGLEAALTYENFGRGARTESTFDKTYAEEEAKRLGSLDTQISEQRTRVAQAEVDVKNAVFKSNEKNRLESEKATLERLTKERDEIRQNRKKSPRRYSPEEVAASFAQVDKLFPNLKGTARAQKARELAAEMFGE